MAKILKVWGPYGEDTSGFRITWKFSALLINGEVQGYTLRFDLSSRKFSVRPHSGAINRRYAESMAQKDLFALPEVQRAEPMKGRVTDILKAHLKPQHVAKATALALKVRSS